MGQEIQHYFTIFDDDFANFDTQTYDWFLHPVVTPAAIRKIQNRYHLKQDIATYNKIFNRIHKVTLDYFTVNFSGRHSGRSFLLALQEEMRGLTPLSYDNHVLLALLHRLHFDVSEFIKYYPYAKSSISVEQKNFNSEQLTVLPATFIYYQDDVIKIESLAQRQIFDFLNEKTAER
ncbi:DsbA family protein [Pseudolactococcus plantarum]|uniref:Dithiol-disulfide isomerase n=1 Tax=Pseudolactococcus plantarum TaxID=1365 RepID=A0A2A5S3F3_9LACT|nr:DsbA family protein [Lactococcus plantarum]PCS07973.1 hypothetical protein RU87_GL000710 [Lactococcus plantarum]HCN74572.1 hypothetical protein [Lactococcus sp.]